MNDDERDIDEAGETKPRGGSWWDDVDSVRQRRKDDA